jgi:glycosyltransferase involved in cell wall biosynthesis
MSLFPIFLSLIITTKNEKDILKKELEDISNSLKTLVDDYELIIIENASADRTISLLRDLTSPSGLPNLQAYALTKEVDRDAAAWAGIENALGDFVVVFNPAEDDLSVLPDMLEKAVSGSDVVFARNQLKPKQTIGYRLANGLFNFMYKQFNGIDLAKEAPEYRVLSKRVINFILQHNQPATSYRHLPATAGFVKSYIEYQSDPKRRQTKKLSESIEKGIRLMVSTTRAPVRLVTVLSLFGAGANLIYSLYVVSIGLFAENVAPGWVSMSLQMSGMFFLISLVLLVLGEYILHMASLSNEGPKYHVGQEFTSAKMTRLEKLNLEEIRPAEKQGA